MNTTTESRWRKSVLTANATLQEVVKNLDATALQIVLIESESGQLIGTVTDGDIRRGLLKGLHMEESIASIIHRDPLVVPPELDRDAVLQLMRANRIRQLPIVDDKQHLVGLHSWDELLVPENRANLIIIMAGGKGTRLRPHTEKCPKPLLPIGGKPMLEHIIERGKAAGFSRFILSVHYLGEMIEDYFGDGEKLQVNIDYLREDTPLGTAGAISLLADRPESSLIVTNGDVLTDINYGELLDFHHRHKACATMAVRLHEWQHPFGVVKTKGLDITGFEEKPVSRSYVNSGIYVLEPDALDFLKPGEHCDMPALFARLKESGASTIVYPIHEPWLDVGRMDDLEKAQEEYAGNADD